MVGPLVICVVFRDAPVRFFTGYRRGDIRISNFIKYRIILDTVYSYSNNSGIYTKLTNLLFIIIYSEYTAEVKGYYRF